MANDELRELFKDAPKFEHMERGELVAHAYGLFAAGNKAGAENAKLRELVKSMYYDLTNMTFPPDWVTDYEADMRELGIEV